MFASHQSRFSSDVVQRMFAVMASTLLGCGGSDDGFHAAIGSHSSALERHFVDASNEPNPADDPCTECFFLYSPDETFRLRVLTRAERAHLFVPSSAILDHIAIRFSDLDGPPSAETVLTDLEELRVGTEGSDVDTLSLTDALADVPPHSIAFARLSAGVPVGGDEAFGFQLLSMQRRGDD